jgi:predicted RND superfamily exporter protein
MDLPRRIVQTRRLWIALACLLTLLAGFFAIRIPINTDIVTFLPQDSPRVQLFRHTDHLFGGNHLAIVGVEAEDIFTSPVLHVVDSLTTGFAGIEGVSSVTSLTNVIDFRKTEGGIEVTKLIEPGQVPDQPEELARLRDYVLARSLYRDKLVSGDGRFALILVRIRGDVDREAVARQLRTLSKNLVHGRYRLYFAGFPFQMEFLGRLIITDLWRLTPIAAVLILGLLYLSFRRGRAALLAFLTVLLSLIWTFGLMGALRLPLTLISAATPVLVLAVGSAYGIHLLKKYYELSPSYGASPELVAETLRQVGTPIVLAAVTTLIGFLSLLSSELSAIRQFGLATGAGILFALAAATLVVTAILASLAPENLPRTVRNSPAGSSRLPLGALASSVARHPHRWAFSLGILALAFVTGFPQISREVNLSEYFKRNSEVRISEKLMEERFGGSYPVQILVQGPIDHPAVLHWMRQLERRLETDPWLTNPQSVADLICEMNQVLNDRYVVPETNQGVANLWLLLEGQEILQQLVTENRQNGQVQLRIRSQDSQRIFHSVDLVNRVLQSLPDTLVVVSDSAVPAEMRAALDSFRVGEAMNALRWEMERRGLSLPEAALRAILERHTGRLRAQSISPAIADSMATAVLRFLTSEESEIPVTEVRGRDFEGLRDAFSRGELQSPRDLAGYLRQALPEARRVDEDALLRTAEHVWYLANEVRQQALTDSSLASLLTLLPKTTAVDPNLRRDLKSALWSLNQERCFVPDDLFREWSRRAPIRAEERVGISAIQSGSGPIYQELDAKLLNSQITSLAFALGLVFLLLCLQLKSLSLGLIGTAPILLTLAVNFGAMGYLGIPLDDATLMIAPLAVGIGVDYAIHISHRLRYELERHSSLEEALRRSFGTTGMAILINALSVGLGFCVLLLGDVEPVRRFGGMVALAMAVSAFGALTLLPALLAIRQRKGSPSGSRGISGS